VLHQIFVTNDFETHPHCSGRLRFSFRPACNLAGRTHAAPPLVASSKTTGSNFAPNEFGAKTSFCDAQAATNGASNETAGATFAKYATIAGDHKYTTQPAGNLAATTACGDQCAKTTSVDNQPTKRIGECPASNSPAAKRAAIARVDDWSASDGGD
jgi:hypothetical protein